MAIQFFIEKYRQPFTGRTFTGVCKFTVPADCTITRLNFHAPTIAGTGWKFCVRKNGSAITPSDPSDVNVVSLGTGTPDVSKTGLSIAAVADDVVQVDLIAFGSGTWTGFEFCLIADDHAGGAVSELSDVDLTGLADGNGLFFDEGSGLWKPGDIPTPTAPALDDLTDVDAPTPTLGDRLVFDGTNWVNEAGSALDLDGDVVGSAGDNTVGGLRKRPISDIAVPTFLADEFSGSSLGSEWNFTNNSGNSVAVSGGHLTFTANNTVFAGEGRLRGNTAFRIAGKTLICSVPSISSISGKDSAFYFGVTGSGSDDSNGVLIYPSLFIGFRLSRDASSPSVFRSAPHFDVNGSADVHSNTTTLTGSGTVWPIFVRLRLISGICHWDVIWAGDTDWTNDVHTFDYSAYTTELDTKKLFVKFGGSSSSNQNAVVDYVRTTYAPTDVLASGDALVWNADNFQFEPQTASGLPSTIPLVTVAPTAAPSVPAGKTALVYHATTHYLYAWNGASWDKVHLDAA